VYVVVIKKQAVQKFEQLKQLWSVILWCSSRNWSLFGAIIGFLSVQTTLLCSDWSKVD